MVEGGRDAATDTMSCCSCVEGCGGRVVRPCPVSNVATRGSARGAIPAAAVPSGHPPATVAAAVAAAASSSSVHPTATSTAGSHSGGFRTPKRISAQTSIPSSGWRVNSSRASSRCRNRCMLSVPCAAPAGLACPPAFWALSSVTPAAPSRPAAIWFTGEAYSWRFPLLPPFWVTVPVLGRGAYSVLAMATPPAA
ncbi:hypothetical protein Vafri_12000 [Volvox africanus]|uniref:Uncharacterized protein n=1 Tax=Volvox africanus TaxID=51714 RepID=A0A8J4BA30_9CHLO|nr:hypothetical protein Vafri_12000 [Volvox africanus]